MNTAIHTRASSDVAGRQEATPSPYKPGVDTPALWNVTTNECAGLPAPGCLGCLQAPVHIAGVCPAGEGCIPGGVEETFCESGHPATLPARFNLPICTDSSVWLRL